MSFGWLGTFRAGSWQAYRKFILEERRDVSNRIRVIQAELARIGEVHVYYGSTTDAEGKTAVTEERVGFEVTPGSSLGKLIQAYVAMGGNPYDISLFLKPDSVIVLDPLDEAMPGKDTQPYQGVNFPKSGDYTSGGGVYDGGFHAVKKYVPARTGGRRKLENTTDANLVKHSRKWVQQEIRYKRNDLEARILKLVDLREQLLEEIDRIAWAVAGVVPSVPDIDTDKFTKELTVAGIVAAIDGIFYEKDEDGVADFSTENIESLGYHPNLLSDISPDEDNTAL